MSNGRPSIQARFSNWLLPRMFPSAYREMGRVIDIMEDAYQRGGMLVPPAQVLRNLQENGQLTDLLVRLRGSVFATGFQFTLADRKAAIKWAKFAYATNVNIESAVDMWTDFGMGQSVTVTSPMPAAKTILEEFTTARRNRPVLGVRNQQEISVNALNEGELAFALWFSPIDGEVTIREVVTENLEIVWEDEDAKAVPLFYVQDTQDGQLFFPDWLAEPDQLERVELPSKAKRTDQESVDGTVLTINNEEVPASQAVMVWANRNRINGRGTPQFKNGLEWAKVLQQFMGDRAAVSRKAAMYTEKITLDGGSRVIDQFQQALGSNLATSTDRFEDTNPPPVTAADWIQNEAVDREWMTRDTGASSSRFDGRMLAGQLSVNTGIPLHWMGFPDALANRSTAEESKIPWLEQIKRYKAWLSSVLEDVARAVLKVMNDNTSAAIDWEKVEITINMETPLNVVLDELRMVAGEIILAVDKEVLPKETGTAVLRELFALALEKIGAANPDIVREIVQEDSMFAMAVKPVMENYENGSISDRQTIEFLIGTLADVVS